MTRHEIELVTDIAAAARAEAFRSIALKVDALPIGLRDEALKAALALTLARLLAMKEARNDPSFDSLVQKLYAEELPKCVALERELRAR